MTAVLIVDDEPDVRTVTRVLLELEGHVVTEAPDGARALELLSGAHDIEMVFLDLRMPGLSGWDVLAQLKQDGHLEQLRVVVFSAHMEPRELQRAVLEGAHGYLTKPFTDEQLYGALRGP